MAYVPPMKIWLETKSHIKKLKLIFTGQTEENEEITPNCDYYYFLPVSILPSFIFNEEEKKKILGRNRCSNLFEAIIKTINQLDRNGESPFELILPTFKARRAICLCHREHWYLTILVQTVYEDWNYSHICKQGKVLVNRYTHGKYRREH